MELEMHIPMTADTECYQVFGRIISQTTPSIEMMHLKAY